MGSFKVNIMVSIMVSQILTKNSFKSGNGLVISPLLRDFSKNILKQIVFSCCRVLTNLNLDLVQGGGGQGKLKNKTTQSGTNKFRTRFTP